MAFLLLAAAAVAVVAGVLALRSARQSQVLASGSRRRETPSRDELLAAARAEAERILADAREAALAARSDAHEELSLRQESIEALEPLLVEQSTLISERRRRFDEHRHALKERRAEMEAELNRLVEAAAEARAQVGRTAAIDRETASRMVLERLDAELTGEQPARVEGAVTAATDDPVTAARSLIASTIQRQDRSHADGAPRATPVSLESLDEGARERRLEILAAIGTGTASELSIDAERPQASLRSLDPVGREIARQAALEMVDRELQVAEVGPLLLKTRRALAQRIREIGERGLWQMEMSGRPELAELVGTLHYRFSYGQNALLHCQETGYLGGVLAAELGMPQAEARDAGMLHDIGKAVDHNVEGSHAIIGGELLRLFGIDDGIIHAVKAHHFDEEPSTDLALLTICADAISASRPGARRDTIAAYLARLEQLQGIATRHAGVERAFPLQAGREMRVLVKAKEVGDADVPMLGAEIAHEIESEMQYPGVIKVVVIREMTATATAPAQVPVLAASPATDLQSADEVNDSNGDANDGDEPSTNGSE